MKEYITISGKFLVLNVTTFEEVYETRVLEFLVGWGAKLGRVSVLFILTKFHRLVYFEKWIKKEEQVTLPAPESNQRPLEYRNANHYTSHLVNQLTTEIGMRSVACTLSGKQVHWPKRLSIMPCVCEIRGTTLRF